MNAPQTQSSSCVLDTSYVNFLARDVNHVLAFRPWRGVSFQNYVNCSQRYAKL